MRSRDAEKRINERRNKDWWEAVNSKRSFRWYGEMHDRGWRMRNWRSTEEDRIVKRYWSGVMEHKVTRCDRCFMSRDSRVEYLLKECTETEWWRRKNVIYKDKDMVDVLRMEEAIAEIERWRCG